MRASDAFIEHLNAQLQDLENQSLYKRERIISSPQNGEITLADGRNVLNFCSNNYLGLADHPEIIAAAKESYDRYGYGLSSVRFICGTQTIHKQLEKRLSHFLGTEDTILYCSCFDANGGLFETLLGPEDAVISDALNHASIIDGIRLCKATRLRYDHNNMVSLEAQLKEADKARFRLIATDGVFSMDGTIANLKEICDLADHYHAMVMVDDCHAVGFLGQHGRGSPEYCHVMGRIDIITGTLEKLWEVRWAVIPQPKNQLLIGLDNVPGLICSPIHWLQTLPQQPSKYWILLKLQMKGVKFSKKIAFISESKCPIMDLIYFPENIRLFLSC